MATAAETAAAVAKAIRGGGSGGKVSEKDKKIPSAQIIVVNGKKQRKTTACKMPGYLMVKDSAAEKVMVAWRNRQHFLPPEADNHPWYKVIFVADEPEALCKASTEEELREWIKANRPNCKRCFICNSGASEPWVTLNDLKVANAKAKTKTKPKTESAAAAATAAAALPPPPSRLPVRRVIAITDD